MAAKRGGPRPGAGRPSDVGERRSHAVQVRLTLDEREAWKAAADGEGASIAEWVRDIVGESLTKRRKAASP